VQGAVSDGGSKPVSATVTYTVSSSSTGSGGTGGAGGSSAPKSAHGSLAGMHFALSLPAACIASTGKLPVSLAPSGKAKGYRPISFSYWIGRGVEHRKRVRGREVVSYDPTLTIGHPGKVSLSLTGLRPGAHTLKLVITLASTKRHGKPEKKTLTLTLPFSVC
jgi:hypothetical protein